MEANVERDYSWIKLKHVWKATAVWNVLNWMNCENKVRFEEAFSQSGRQADFTGSIFWQNQYHAGPFCSEQANSWEAKTYWAMLMDICFTSASCAVCVLQACAQFYTLRGEMKESVSVICPSWYLSDLKHKLKPASHFPVFKCERVWRKIEADNCSW